MPTQLDIYNRAMAAIGQRSTIASTAETSVEALALTSHYEALRKELLESFLWGFARRASNLGSPYKNHPGVPSPISSAGSAPNTAVIAVGSNWGPTWPSPPWLYEFRVPSDFLRARWVTPRTGATLAESVSPLPSHDVYYTMNPPYQFVVGSDTDTGSTPADAAMDVILTNISSCVLVYTADVTDPNAWSAMFTQAMVLYLAGRVAFQLTQDMEVTKLALLQAENLINRSKVMSANQGLTVTATTPDWIRVRGVNVADDSLGFLP